MSSFTKKKRVAWWFFWTRFSFFKSISFDGWWKRGVFKTWRNNIKRQQQKPGTIINTTGIRNDCYQGEKSARSFYEVSHSDTLKQIAVGFQIIPTPFPISLCMDPDNNSWMVYCRYLPSRWKYRGHFRCFSIPFDERNKTNFFAVNTIPLFDGKVNMSNCPSIWDSQVLVKNNKESPKKGEGGQQLYK